MVGTRALAPLLTATLLLAACSAPAEEVDAGGADAATTAAPSTPTDATATPERRDDPADDPEDEVPETLQFSATTVDGDRLEGATLAGSPVLLWFWAPWCPTCRGQVPQVEALASEHEGRLAVVGVGSLDSAEAIADFAGEVAGVTHVVDTDGELWQRFGITEQSSFVLLDDTGAVAFETGYGGSDELEQRVDDVLG